MHLNIKNDEAHRLATELADLTGQSLTAAVLAALRAAVGRTRRLTNRAERIEQLMAIGRRYAALPGTEFKTPEDVIGYDENGLPT